jgi:predicted RNA-binding protein with PIN domain
MQEHLMIDGNNAIHAIPELLEELAIDRNQARDSLVRMLEPVTNTGARLTVVFDGRGGRSSIQKFGSSNLLDVVYSSSQEGADGVIERMVMASKYPAQICVVTNDNLIRNCAFSCGASAMRVDQLIKKLEYSIDQITRQVEQRKGKKNNWQEPFHNKLDIPEL